MTFSEKLITLRGGRGWTQEQLAEKLGVTRQTVSNWERALSLPDAVGLTALSRVFNVDAEWLLDESADSCPSPGEWTSCGATGSFLSAPYCFSCCVLC